MSEKYFELNSEALENFLTSKGFVRTVNGNEVVYTRQHHICPALQIKIYTTIAANRNTSRGCGSDAIRIVSIFDDGVKNFGVGKFPRIYRRAPETLIGQAAKQAFLTDRIVARLRDAYARCNEWSKENYSKNRKR